MSNAPHILVIDDEPQILRAIRTILTEKEFKVSTANTGEEGLTLAATNEPDIVILDLGLPDAHALANLQQFVVAGMQERREAEGTQFVFQMRQRVRWQDDRGVLCDIFSQECWVEVVAVQV